MPFCNKCGTEVPENVNFCQKCGYALQSGQSTTANNNNTEAIWNPAVAALLGILVTPIAIFIHYLNWKTLKQENEAKTALIWFAISIIVSIVCNSMFEDIFIGSGLYWLALIIWYFANGTNQTEYVRKKYGTIYNRKSWVFPIFASILTIVIFTMFEIGSYYNNGEREPLTDLRDGKVYKTVKIGKQIWMAENLNYDDKGKIGVCYDNDFENCKKYGRLYNWSEAMEICPDGWHLPSISEWETLYKYISGNNFNPLFVATQLKAKTGWEENGIDYYGFAALPGGSKICANMDKAATPIDCIDKFIKLGVESEWWSSTEELFNGELKKWEIDSYSGSRWGKFSSTSVRCLKGKGK